MENNFLQKIVSFYKKKQIIIANIFLILAVISFSFSYYKNREDITVPFFNSIYSNVAINVEFNKQIDNILILKTGTNGYLRIQPRLQNNFTGNQNNSITFIKPLNKIEIAFFSKDKQTILNNISNISIFVGKDYWSFDKNQIKNFPESNDKIGNTDLTVLELPKEVTKIKNCNHLNYKGLHNEITVFLLSIFYCYRIYLIPWILLICGIFSLKENPLAKYKFFPIFAIFLIGIFIRLNMYVENGFWWDEHYIVTFTGNPNTPWSRIFDDPGNPPLFPFLSKIWFYLGDYSIEWARLLPVIFGSLSLLTLYFLTKDRINKSVATLVTLLTTFSVYHISYSQEYRSYPVSLFLVPLVTYFLFKVLEKESGKNAILFIISSALLINNHFFGIVVVFFNFCYGIYYYIKNSIHDNKILNFILMNVIIALTFMPYAIKTFIERALLDPTYNSWIQKFSLRRLSLMINSNFGHIYILLGVILLCIIFLYTNKSSSKVKFFDTSNKKSMDYLTYLIFLIAFVYIFTFIFSIKRSLLVPYYYIIVYPFLLTIMTSFACLKWNKKFINVIMTVLLIYSFGTITFNNAWKINRAYNYLSDIARTQADLNPDYTVIAMIDPVEYAQIFPKATNLIWHGHYNGLDEDVPMFTDFVNELILKNNLFFKRKIIVCVTYKGLNKIDRDLILNNYIHKNIEYFSTPTFENDVIKITIEPNKQ